MPHFLSVPATNFIPATNCLPIYQCLSMMCSLSNGFKLASFFALWTIIIASLVKFTPGSSHMRFHTLTCEPTVAVHTATKATQG